MILPSRIRFDDAIVKSSDPKFKDHEVQKFLKNVNWCLKLDVPLTPAILCEEITRFPGGIEILRRMTKEGKIYPDLHGWDHGPYATRPQKEIEEHLEKSMNWFKKNLDTVPIRWVTPHGAKSDSISAAANKFSLVVESTDYPVIDQKVLDNKLRVTRDLSILENRVIMNHFWERGLRLYRIARIIQFQSVNEAIAETKRELTQKDHQLCWGVWMDL